MKINAQFSAWSDILTGVPQGSILFNIHICDSFFQIINSDIAKYTDGNTTYVYCDSTDEVIQNLQDISKKLLKWFEANEMKSNPDKCHLLMSLNEPVTRTIGLEEISN